ncbi:hypothetical protein Cantr_06255 [Candida viswanathii]|uniref:Uncharacterized protein n=1 Tax=Candida viswanathii TaxID=5486 RepID=A0A367XWH5_9ASCO|nr:hypothetical protein Cantr_06255 [Candida viswanathii]
MYSMFNRSIKNSTTHRQQYLPKNGRWKYLFYPIDTDQPTFNQLNAEGTGISEEEARECFVLIEFVPLSTLHDVIYNLAHIPCLSNSVDAYDIGQFYHMLYFTKEGDEIDARSKAFSFENTDELAELVFNGNILSILSLIQYDRIVGILHVLYNCRDNGGGDSRTEINQISLYVIGNDSVAIPMGYVDQFKVLRMKDEREWMATQFKFHPYPPYYVDTRTESCCLDTSTESLTNSRFTTCWIRAFR